MTHREIALVVALVIPIVGLLVEFVRRQSRLAGFREFSKDLQVLIVDLNGEVDRDGDDLLVRGHYGKWPVLLRFSRSEYEAGVSIQMSVPGNLTLYCYPVAHEGEEGQVPLAISDQRFMAHFRLSTNNTALEISMLLSSPAVLAELSKITDSQTYITLENQILELSEAVIVPDHLGSRLMNRVRGMARIAAEAAEVHGGGSALLASSKRPANWFRIAYIGASVLILLALGISFVADRTATKAEAESISKPAMPTIPQAYAAQIPQLQGWHVADANEFDPDASTWLQQQGQRVTGHLSASLNSDQTEDEAYVFKRPAGAPGTNSSRLVLFIDKQEKYDAEMPHIDAVGRISKEAIGSVEWRGRKPHDSPDGDGILVIQRYREPSSAIILFMSGAKLITAVPKDVRSLSLGE